jgi:BRCA1-associated protein
METLLTAEQREICHVTVIKSITIERPSTSNGQAQDPKPVINTSLKPFPPPTPNLIELPTCPVCLERMDDTTGLMTILCQHVFHCTCLQTWKGSGCPVCRATNPSLLAAEAQDAGHGSSASPYDPDHPSKLPFGSDASNLCSVCDCADDLWICLICGNVGCGRYKGGHAKDHWKETAHSFSLELETQHVWDYAGDMWVHRLIREKGEGKVVELPSHRRRRQRRLVVRRVPAGTAEDGGSQGGGDDEQQLDVEGYADEEEEEEDEEVDVVPRAKLDRIGLEYTHLLTSQLESQRVYFEELVSKAVDKATKASSAAEGAASQAQHAARDLAALRAEHDVLQNERVPSLERALARETARAARAAELARSLGASLQEERKVGEGLMARVRHLQAEVEALARAADGLRADKAELAETNRDLMMTISGAEAIRSMAVEGRIEAGEVEEGRMVLPEEAKGKGKGKGKAKR